MQLPGLLGFPHGEEQAPGEQVELREEKGAKSESSPSQRGNWETLLRSTVIPGKLRNLYQAVTTMASGPAWICGPSLHTYPLTPRHTI